MIILLGIGIHQRQRYTALCPLKHIGMQSKTTYRLNLCFKPANMHYKLQRTPKRVFFVLYGSCCFSHPILDIPLYSTMVVRSFYCNIYNFKIKNGDYTSNKVSLRCFYVFTFLFRLREIHFSSSPFSTYRDVSILNDGNPGMCIISYDFLRPHLNIS